MESFSYKNKGFMAEIGKRTAVANIFGRNLHGLLAWMLWRSFYLSGLPGMKKKARVLTDWNADLIFGHDVTMIKMLAHRKNYWKELKKENADKIESADRIHPSHNMQKKNPANPESEGKTRTTEAA